MTGERRLSPAERIAEPLTAQEEAFVRSQVEAIREYRDVAPAEHAASRLLATLDAVRGATADTAELRSRLDAALHEWWADDHGAGARHACRPVPTEDEFVGLARIHGITLGLAEPKGGAS